MDSSLEHREDSEQTPQQLNAQLRAIFQMIPDIDPSDRTAKNIVQKIKQGDDVPEDDLSQLGPSVDDFLNSTYRRKNSEYFKRLEIKLKELLNKANITPSFSNWIGEKMSTAILVGLDREDQSDPANDYLGAWLVDPENPESGGIFDQARAKEMERRAYRIQAVEALSFQRRLDKNPQMHAFLSGKNIFEDKVQTWKKEFANLYHEEPWVD